MPHRFALRFENGERRGERVELAGTMLAVGRRPGSDLQILDASVSGQHAEFIAISGSVHVRDLGSTNGTRVGAERISERELAHGDQVLIGNVRLVFLDAEVGSAPPLSAPGAVDAVGLTGSPEALGEAVRTVSAEHVELSGKRSLIVGVLLLLLAAGGIVGGLWWRDRGTGPARAVLDPVVPVEGNLLATGFSFERGPAPGNAAEVNGGQGAWRADERAPAEFALDSRASHTGVLGLSVDLNEAPDGPDGPDASGLPRTPGSAAPLAVWAVQRSDLVDAPRGKSIHARAWVRAEGDATVRLGLSFEDSSGSAGPTLAWSAPLSPAVFEPLDLTCRVPAGYDRVRLEIVAHGLGSAAFDDASLVATAVGSESPAVGEYELFLLGEPARAMTLFKIDRLLVSDLHALPAGPSGASGTPATGTAGGTGGAPGARVPLHSTTGERGFTLAPGADAARTARLSLRVEAPLLAGGIATVGEGGYRTHQIAFELAGISSLLFGSGRDLVRLGLESPARVHGRPEGEGFRIEIDGGASWDLQLVFSAERVEARNLAHAARQAEAQGAVGESIAHWTRLTESYPFEAELLEEAQVARTRLIQSGLAELRVLGQRVERARFFRLVELFRLCRAEASEVAVRFAETEVEAPARALEAEILSSSAELERDLSTAERARLEAIARALTADSPKLAARVHEYLERQFGEDL